MKKTLSIIALSVIGFGFVSCKKENKEERKEDRDHALLQSVNKKSDCEIIERGDKFTTKKMLFLTTDQSSGIPR